VPVLVPQLKQIQLMQMLALQVTQLELRERLELREQQLR
jgi:hypothetical protein